MMFSTNKLMRAGGYIWGCLIGLCLLSQPGCGEAGPSSTTALSGDAPCSAAEVRRHVREHFANQGVGVAETVSNGGTYVIVTEFIPEPGSERRERQVRYKLEVKQGGDANTSGVRLNWEIRSKGIRESDWRDDTAAGFKPERWEQIWQQVKGVCPSAR
jgi:hypothetical protein